MFLILLGGSLTFGAALLATVIFTEGALVALRTAAQVIGWLFVLATLVGVAGMRRASLGPLCAASVTLCSGLAALYMSYFFEWNELPRPVVRHAAPETFAVRPVAYTYKVIDPVMLPTKVQIQEPLEEAAKPALRREAAKPAPRREAAKPAPRRKLVAAAQPVSLAADACSTLAGVESLQCNRCSEQLGFSWVMCQESVRLQYCETELGDERACPSPIPQSHPG